MSTQRLICNGLPQKNLKRSERLLGVSGSDDRLLGISNSDSNDRLLGISAS